MTTSFSFVHHELPPETEALRAEVRAFLAEEIAAGSCDPLESGSVAGFDRNFSRKVGARGWIGMTWPKKYGGHERSFLERYVVTEEFRVASAPVGTHFTADRQSGPMLLKYAAEDIKADILPRIASGEPDPAGVSRPAADAGIATVPQARPSTPRRMRVLSVCHFMMSLLF